MAAFRLRLPRRIEDPEGRPRPAPVVPNASIAGSALVMVIAIMTFLASLTVGAVDLVRGATRGWDAQIAQEVTIQVRPLPGRDIEQAVARAAEIARTTAGIADVRPFTREDTAKLLEPWLGTGLKLDELPAPRLIVLRLATDKGAADLAGLSAALEREVPGASLDDHRVWGGRLRSVSSTVVGFGLGILVLVLAATSLSVVFATRGAMAGNNEVVEVLHIVGAHDSFVARAFAHRFLLLGLRGGSIGGGLAVLVFLVMAWATSHGRPEMRALFGELTLDPSGYVAVLAVAALIAGLAAATSRITALAFLRRLD
jgi:cell division transport system permease protein